MSLPHLLFVLGLLSCVGCGGQTSFNSRAFPEQSAGEPQDIAQSEITAKRLGDSQKADARQQFGPVDPNVKQADAAGAPALPRKIIYDTHVQLIVPDVVRAEAELRDLIKRSEALVASSEITERATSARRLTLRVRVPVERYEGFLEALTKLGRPERIKADSQDVTEEFYDLADRIKNKRLEQDTLREYLLEKKATSKLEDILTVEREIGRVREELDRLEGRLRRLDALSSLATVNIVLEQRWDQPWSWSWRPWSPGWWSWSRWD
jgi:hypothetical protein